MAKKVGGIFIDLSANVARIQRDVSRVISALGSIGDTVRSNLAVNIAALSYTIGKDLFGSIQKASVALLKLTRDGEKAGSIAENFEKLGGSNGAIERANRALLGTVSKFDLMAAANKGLVAGLAGFDEKFGDIADLANRFADATGGDAKESIDNLVQALVTGNSKALKPFGIELQEGATKAENTRDAMLQLTDAINKFAPAGDSAANAQEAFITQLQDGRREIAIAINNNEDLREAWRELANVIDSIDWQQLGDDIAYVFTEAIKFAQGAIPWIQDFFHQFTLGIKVLGEFKAYFDGLNLKESLDKAVYSVALDEQKQKLLELRDSANTGISQLASSLKGAKDQSDLGPLAKQIENVAQSLSKVPSTNPLHKTFSQLQDVFGSLSTTLPEVDSKLEKVRNGLPPIERDAEKAANELERLRERIKSFDGSEELSDVRRSLQEGMSLDDSEWSKLTEKLRVVVERGTREGLLAGANAPDSELAGIQERARKKAQIEVEEANKQRQDFLDKEFERQQKLADKQAEELKRAYEEGVREWESLWSTAIDGAIEGDLASSLKKVFDDVLRDFFSAFLAGISQGLFGSLGSSSGLGNSLAQMLIGEVKGSFFGSDSSTSALGAATGATGILGSFGGGAGVMLASGEVVAAGSAAAAGGVASAALPGAGVLGAIGPWGAAGVAALALGSQFIGDKELKNWFGIGGAQNKETIARKDLSGAIEELIRGSSGSRGAGYFDNEGNIRYINDIKIGSSDRLNDPNWMNDPFNTYGGKSTNAYVGVFSALSNKLGIEGDAAGMQTGILALQQFSGSMEALQAIVGATGITWDEFVNNLVAGGKKGADSWLSIVSQIRDGEAAFKDGIEGLGEVGKAFENLLRSEGKGQLALNQVKNIAVEAKEKGITSLDQLKQYIISTGQFTAVEIEGLFNALAKNQITSLDQLASATDLKLAYIVAALDAYLQDNGAGFRQATEAAKQTADTIKGIPDSQEKALKLKVTSSIDSATQDLMRSGAFDGTGIDKAVQVVTSSGRLSSPSDSGTYRAPATEADVSISGGTRAAARSSPSHLAITINAPNSGRGVDGDILEALSMSNMHLQAITNSIAQQNSWRTNEQG